MRAQQRASSDASTTLWRAAPASCTATTGPAPFTPTVVDHIPHEAELVREETFGPVIPIVRVPDDIDEVIRISNSTAYGLSSGVSAERSFR